MASQGVQADLPELAVVLQPRRRLLEGLDLHAAVVLPADNVAVDEPGAFEHLHVLRDGVQRHGKPPGDLGDGGRSPAERHQDGAPGRIRDRREHAVQHDRLMFNQLVEVYTRQERLSRTELNRANPSRQITLASRV